MLAVEANTWYNKEKGAEHVKKWVWIGVGIVCVVILLFAFGQFYERIFPANVQEVRLRIYHESGCGRYHEVSLTKSEADKLLWLYNLSRHGGEVNAEPGTDDFLVDVYRKNGSVFRISQGVRDCVIARPSKSQCYYVQNQKLIDYIKELMIKYRPLDI